MICSRCNYDNRAGAVVCTRCGSALNSGNGVAVAADKSKGNLDWLMQGTSAHPIAGPEGDNDSGGSSAHWGSSGQQSESTAAPAYSGSVALAAQWQVQVRKSRAPLLIAFRTPIPADETETTDYENAAAQQAEPTLTPPESVLHSKPEPPKAAPRQGTFDARVFILALILIALLIVLFVLATGRV